MNWGNDLCRFSGSRSNPVPHVSNWRTEKGFKLKYQNEMIGPLNRNQKETVTDILALSISELKSELIGRSMLLKNFEE